MKRSMLSIILCLFLLLPAALGEEAFCLRLIVREDQTPYWSAPDQMEAAGLLQAGEPVTVLALGANYCLIEADGRQGFIAADRLALPENAEQPVKIVKANVHPTAQGYLTLRAVAARNGEMLAGLRYGTLMAVLGEDGEFYQVATADQTGYVMAKSTAEARIGPGEWRQIENDDPVNFRSLQEYAERSVMTQLQPGEWIYIFRDQKGWALGEAGGCQGYIVSKYLSD